MRYLVLGCGAIGGTVAAGLVRDDVPGSLSRLADFNRRFAKSY